MYFVLLSVYTISPWGAVLMGSVVSTNEVRVGFEPTMSNLFTGLGTMPHYTPDLPVLP